MKNKKIPSTWLHGIFLLTLSLEKEPSISGERHFYGRFNLSNLPYGVKWVLWSTKKIGYFWIYSYEIFFLKGYV